VADFVSLVTLSCSYCHPENFYTVSCTYHCLLLPFLSFMYFIFVFLSFLLSFLCYFLVKCSVTFVHLTWSSSSFLFFHVLYYIFLSFLLSFLCYFLVKCSVTFVHLTLSSSSFPFFHVLYFCLSFVLVVIPLLFSRYLFFHVPTFLFYSLFTFFIPDSST
jgi:hypothetical protein